MSLEEHSGQREQPVWLLRVRIKLGVGGCLRDMVEGDDAGRQTRPCKGIGFAACLWEAVGLSGLHTLSIP